jgi:BioD-like phosphotransacetylase family protein
MSKATVPRIYVAATRQNDGKTTACIGLMSALSTRYKNLGFIKPVGQRYVERDGHRIDADAVLMQEVYNCKNSLIDMSPIAVDRHFTRRYIENPEKEKLEQLVYNSFMRVAENKDMVLVEGTGHAGVGAVFDLNNARVASLLSAPTIIVACGGIGRPFDEIMLNKAVFEKHGVPILGVIINKVRNDKMEETQKYLSQALARVDLPLLGVIPRQPPLLQPTIKTVVRALGGELLNGEQNLNTHVHSFIIGAMTPHRALHYIKENSLLITPGDRDDLVLTAISLASTSKRHKASTVAGIVLTGGVRPRRSVMQVIQRTEIPVILSKEDTYKVASNIYDMMVKITPDDDRKIKLVRSLYMRHFSLDTLCDKIDSLF